MMHMPVRHIVLALALLLGGCDVKSRSVPIDDPDGIRTVMADLSPWRNGSADRSHDRRTPGEPGSDRRLFATWIQTYHSGRQYSQHGRDYVPQAVPSSVADAIAEQRAIYEKDEAQTAARVAEMQAEQRRRDASDRQRAIQSERDSAAYQVQLAADRVDGDARFSAEVKAQGERDAARQACIDERQNAALSAGAADYQRVWTRFPACERMP